MKHKILAVTFLVLSACETLPTGPEQIPDTSYRPGTSVGRALENCLSVGHIYADSSFTIAPGVEETDVHLQTMEGKVEHIFFLKVSIGQEGTDVMVGLADDKDRQENFIRQTPSMMAQRAAENGKNVVAAVNGDFWDTSSGAVRGPVHRDWKILKETFVYSSDLTDQAISFFGILGDGTPIIRDAAEYSTLQADLKHCTGSGVIVLRDGEVPSDTDFSIYSPYRHPRTCVGYSEDGNTLWFFVCDGRQTLWSDGMLYYEMGEIMKSLGCSWAVNLDGGGSSQLVIKNPENSTYTLRNRASDGCERAVVNTWLICS